jgi:hypothetical protein
MYSLLLLAAVVMPPIADLFDRAAKRSGHSHKELAYCLGTTPPRLCHMVKGEGSSLSLARLFLAPESFRAALLDELREAWGIEKPLTARDVLDLIRPVMAAKGEDRCEKCA